MYIFRPTTDYHMVGHPLNGQERLAVALRYYDIRRVPEACLDFSPAPLSVEERKARMEGFIPTPKKTNKTITNASNQKSFWSCNKCGTFVPDHFVCCIVEECRTPRDMRSVMAGVYPPTPPVVHELPADIQPFIEDACGGLEEHVESIVEKDVEKLQGSATVEDAHLEKNTQEEGNTLLQTNIHHPSPTNPANPVISARKRGRPAGSKNVVSKEKKKLQTPAATKFSPYWSKHRVIPNPNKGATLYCAFYGQSLTGMCPHCDVHQKDHPKTSSVCEQCKIPLHPECMWEWHSRHEGFDGNDWYLRNVTGAVSQLPLLPNLSPHPMYPFMYSQALQGIYQLTASKFFLF